MLTLVSTMGTYGQFRGDRLRSLREAKGWSLRHLERRCGLSNAMISQLETGKQTNPSLDTIAKLAHELSVSIGYLVGELDAPHGAVADNACECGLPIKAGEIYCACGAPVANFCIADENHTNRLEAKFCDRCGCRTILGLTEEEREAYMDAHRRSRSKRTGRAEEDGRGRNHKRRIRK